MIFRKRNYIWSWKVAVLQHLTFLIGWAEHVMDTYALMVLEDWVKVIFK